MALSIRNKKAEALAREAAREGGETITEAIIHALEDRRARFQGRRTAPDLVEQILDIVRRSGALPDLDGRPAEEILGYNRDGAVE